MSRKTYLIIHNLKINGRKGRYGGKLYLGSYAHRLGATGLTFYDDQVTDFFSPHAKGKSVMFMVVIGKKV